MKTAKNKLGKKFVSAYLLISYGSKSTVAVRLSRTSRLRDGDKLGFCAKGQAAPDHEFMEEEPATTPHPFWIGSIPAIDTITHRELCSALKARGLKSGGV